MDKPNKWIGVDLDGTLAIDDTSSGEYNLRHIGPPVPLMVERVKAWLNAGYDVRIFTARVSGERDGVSIQESMQLIQAWCLKYIGRVLPVTCTKDYRLLELWDDRACQVRKNTGELIGVGADLFNTFFRPLKEGD